MNDLQRLVEDLKPRFRTLNDLAKAIGMTLSGFSRGIKTGTLSVENLLKLAKVSNRPAADVFRMADKLDELQLIEELFPTNASAPTRAERELLDRWELIPDPIKTPVHDMVWGATQEAYGKAQQRKKRSA